MGIERGKQLLVPFECGIDCSEIPPQKRDLLRLSNNNKKGAVRKNDVPREVKNKMSPAFLSLSGLKTRKTRQKKKGYYSSINNILDWLIENVLPMLHIYIATT